MTATLSFDIEEFDFPIEKGRTISEDDQFSISKQGLQFILDTLKKRDIKATFFVTANFAKHEPEMVKKILSLGHELASHDFYHSMSSNSASYESRIFLEELTGEKIIGYRAPRLSSESSAELFKSGYSYNSSINPTWIPGRYNNLLTPRMPYMEDGLKIFPVSVAYPIRVPLFWLALHVFPLPLYKLLAKTALLHDKNINLYFHPWEFSERTKEKQFGIPGYIAKTSGVYYQNKFSAFVDWLSSLGTQFITTKEYLSL